MIEVLLLVNKTYLIGGNFFLSKMEDNYFCETAQNKKAIFIWDRGSNVTYDVKNKMILRYSDEG